MAEPRTVAERGRRERLQAALNRPELKAAIRVARTLPELQATITAMENRQAELNDGAVISGETARDYTALLAGIGANPRSRGLVEMAIDLLTDRESRSLGDLMLARTRYTPEVVIGSGLHAAIYASTKVAAGGKPPLVIEQRERIGGVFGLTQRPVFYLNSRNRPESRRFARKPGTPGPLNSQISGAIQPSDIGSEEYQTQADLGFITRLNLVIYARTLTGTQVTQITRNDSGARYNLFLRKGGAKYKLATDRILIASGVGTPRDDLLCDDPRVMTFEQWVEQVGDTNNPFPLSGFKKTAVVGANDSGNVAIEYLLGQGPPAGLSVPALDLVEQIAWIGQTLKTKEDFEANTRSRYKGIGRSMPRASDPDYYYRVDPVPGRAKSVTPSKKGVKVRIERPDGGVATGTFDRVILATGSNKFDFLTFESRDDEAMVNDRVVGRIVDGDERSGIFKIGPCANLPVTEQEREEVPALRQIPDNSVAAFRYGELTASLAVRLASMEPVYPDSVVDLLGMVLPRGTSVKGEPRPIPDGPTYDDVIKFLAALYYPKGKPRRLTVSEKDVRNLDPNSTFLNLVQNPYFQMMVGGRRWEVAIGAGEPRRLISASRLTLP